MPAAGWKTKKTKQWPENHRECNRCGELKNSEHFSPFKNGRNGLYPICKTCRTEDSKKQWKAKPVPAKILDRCKSRSTKHGIEFNLTIEDIPDIPDLCPVFGVPMTGRYKPSIDRIDSTKGYVKGNVQIISLRANTLKNDATPEEIKMLSDFLNSTIGSSTNDG